MDTAEKLLSELLTYFSGALPHNSVGGKLRERIVTYLSSIESQESAARQEQPVKPPVWGKTHTEQDGPRGPTVRGVPAVAAPPTGNTPETDKHHMTAEQCKESAHALFVPAEVSRSLERRLRAEKRVEQAEHGEGEAMTKLSKAEKRVVIEAMKLRRIDGCYSMSRKLLKQYLLLVDACAALQRERGRKD